MKPLSRNIVCAMIYDQLGALLMVKKNPAFGGVYIDCWQIPGGGVEPGESHLEALQREISEEVGLTVCGVETTLIDDTGTGTATRRNKLGIDELVEMRFFVYRVNLTSPGAKIGVTLGSELSEYRWVMPDELSGLKLTPPGIELLTKLGLLRTA